jgi:hypothetical protein
MAHRFIAVLAATKEIVNPNVSSREDEAVWLAEVLPTIDPTYELVCYYEPYPPMPPDEGIQKVVGNGIGEQGEYADTPHPDFPTVKQWRKTYSLVDLDVASKKAAVISRKEQANATLIPVQEQLRDIYTFGLALLEHIGYNETTTSLNTKKKKYIRRFKKVAKSIQNNDDLKDTKLAAVDASQNPGLNVGWSENNYVEDVTTEQ